MTSSARQDTSVSERSSRKCRSASWWRAWLRAASPDACRARASASRSPVVPGVVERGGRRVRGGVAGREPGAGQRARGAQPRGYGGVQPGESRGPVRSANQLADPSAQPQRPGRFGLDLADDVAVVRAGEDQVGDGDGFGRALGLAQYRQAAQAQLEPSAWAGRTVRKASVARSPASSALTVTSCSAAEIRIFALARSPGVAAARACGAATSGSPPREVVVGQHAVQIARRHRRVRRRTRSPGPGRAGRPGVPPDARIRPDSVTSATACSPSGPPSESGHLGSAPDGPRRRPGGPGQGRVGQRGEAGA